MPLLEPGQLKQAVKLVEQRYEREYFCCFTTAEHRLYGLHLSPEQFLRAGIGHFTELCYAVPIVSF
jgi:hypothetical protein